MYASISVYRESQVGFAGTKGLKIATHACPHLLEPEIIVIRIRIEVTLIVVGTPTYHLAIHYPNLCKLALRSFLPP